MAKKPKVSKPRLKRLFLSPLKPKEALGAFMKVIPDKVETRIPQTGILLTTGYAGHDLDSFLLTLKRHHVQVVIDVRQNPISRKKGFSRSGLHEFLKSNDVEYIHECELGVPIELRKQLKSGEKDIKSYLNCFRKHLTSHTETLDRLYDLASKKRCCLICVEQLPEECHRSVVAEAIKSRNGHKVKVVHL